MPAHRFGHADSTKRQGFDVWIGVALRWNSRFRRRVFILQKVEQIARDLQRFYVGDDVLDLGCV
jgi:hypothetical protein